MEWISLISLFIHIAGFVIGLGAVTVIDLHGFLARKSSYWTEATIRSHKVTKPLIWFGITLVTLGGLIFYRNEWNYISVQALAGIALLLILNGAYLSYVISPELLVREREGKAKDLLPNTMQLKITISFVFSFLGWWGGLLLSLWNLMNLY